MPSSRILSPKATSSTDKAASSCSKKSSTFRSHKAVNKSPSITITHLGKIIQKKNRTSLQRLWQFTEDPCVAALAPQAVLCRGCGVPKLLDSRGKAEYYDGFWTKHKISCAPCHKLIPGGHPEHPLIEGMVSFILDLFWGADDWKRNNRLQPALTNEVRQEIQRQIKLDVKSYEEHLKKKKPAIDPETLKKISSSRPLAVIQTATLSPAPQSSPEHLTIPLSPRWALTDATASESQHDLPTSNSIPSEESADEIEWEGSLGQQVYRRMQELRIQRE